MKRYLIIQSQDPFTQTRVQQHYTLAQSLEQAGNSVRVLLVQHGVNVALDNSDSTAFERLLDTGIRVFADSYALAERNIADVDVRDGIAIADVTLVVEALLAGDNVIWH